MKVCVVAIQGMKITEVVIHEMNDPGSGGQLRGERKLGSQRLINQEESLQVHVGGETASI